jgi:hypothetical protein
MARLKLSPSGLRSPLDVSSSPDAPAAEARAADVALAAPPHADPPVADVDVDIDSPDARDAIAVAEAPAVDPASADAAAPAVAAEALDPIAVAVPDPIVVPEAEPTVARSTDRAPVADDLPEWAVELDPAALRPARLLGRPKQTALILDRALSARADDLVAATGPRVTFAALVIAVLHFHLPVDGEAAARAIGGYRRRKLETLDHPWEERNARLPEPLRAELDDVVSGAVGRVASVRRSTLVNALLDAHLPGSPDEASRMVTRMEMVRGGAFLG